MAVGIRRYDQHVAKREGPGAALVGEQRTAPPFARLTVLAGQPRARHGDPRLAKRAPRRPLAMSVAHADNRRRRLVLLRPAPAVARTRQRLAQFLFQHRLDEAAYRSSDPVLDRVEPIIRRRQPPPWWYHSSWRGLRSSAPTPESFGLNDPETTPTQLNEPAPSAQEERG